MGCGTSRNSIVPIEEHPIESMSHEIERLEHAHEGLETCRDKISDQIDDLESEESRKENTQRTIEQKRKQGEHLDNMLNEVTDAGVKQTQKLCEIAKKVSKEVEEQHPTIPKQRTIEQKRKQGEHLDNMLSEVTDAEVKQTQKLCEIAKKVSKEVEEQHPTIPKQQDPGSSP